MTYPYREVDQSEAITHEAIRLHGRSGWRYRYELGELKELATSLVKSKRGYVFFNNSKMTEDALRFCKCLGIRKV